MKKELIIAVHRNPTLVRLVVDLLEKSNHTNDTLGVRSMNPSYLYAGRGYLLQSGTGSAAGWQNATKIDAATEMLKLIEALENQPVKINESYTAEVKDDKSGVQVGCTFVSKDIVSKIYEALK